MTRAFGWTGNLLRVDLSTGKTAVEPSGPHVRKFLGGRGMGPSILFKELDPCVGPLDAGNKVVVSTGPLVGTMAPMACRLSVETKNLQAGGVCSSKVRSCRCAVPVPPRPTVRGMPPLLTRRGPAGPLARSEAGMGMEERLTEGTTPAPRNSGHRYTSQMEGATVPDAPGSGSGWIWKSQLDRT